MAPLMEQGQIPDNFLRANAPNDLEHPDIVVCLEGDGVIRDPIYLLWVK